MDTRQDGGFEKEVLHEDVTATAEFMNQTFNQIILTSAEHQKNNSCRDATQVCPRGGERGHASEKERDKTKQVCKNIINFQFPLDIQPSKSSHPVQ